MNRLCPSSQLACVRCGYYPWLLASGVDGLLAQRAQASYEISSNESVLDCMKEPKFGCFMTRPKHWRQFGSSSLFHLFLSFLLILILGYCQTVQQSLHLICSLPCPKASQTFNQEHFRIQQEDWVEPVEICCGACSGMTQADVEAANARRDALRCSLYLP